MVYNGKTQYVLVEELINTPETGPYHTYGIAAFRHTSYGAERLAWVGDVSTDRSFAAWLVERCNRDALSPEHLQDVIEDMIGL